MTQREDRRGVTVASESWPIAGSFAISRGSKTAAEVVVVTLREENDHGAAIGRGECVPYGRYGETIAGVTAQIEALRPALEQGMDRMALQAALPAGAARNAVDCALWDLAAKQMGRSAAELAGLSPLQAVTTAYTLSLGNAEAMAEAARAQAHRPLLKLKLTGPGDLDRVRAVHANAPQARLIIDANEAWTPAIFAELAPRLAPLGVEMIEQPLPADADAALADLDRPIAVCADESCHDRASLPALVGKYDAVNIKLDKTGGLTEALALAESARAQGFALMVGCMVATSLAMAPALLVAQGARWVDVDGPLLLARDREPGLRYEGSLVHPAPPELWG
ncbi:N-acetyl-D-Glu racemase DgcA [Rhodospirillaceae bacterium SYSU D60014]|uniref:N-acetyl-D-Glu racemase DgcA n=1 Tax=Virgifigura deserti TaxID=2268457 RepID=UPI000E6680B4